MLLRFYFYAEFSKLSLSINKHVSVYGINDLIFNF